MTTVLVTGSTGFVGGQLANRWRDEYDVITLNRVPASISARSIAWNFRGDLPASMPAGVDVIVHAAATDGRDAATPDRECFDINVVATQRLLEYAARIGVKQFVYFSTGSVYPLSPVPCHESDPVMPVGHYAATKAAAESLVLGYQQRFKTVVCRLFHPYGPGQRTPRLVAGLIERIQNGQEVCLNGPDGQPTINPAYVDDVVEWVSRLMNAAATGVFNLAGPEAISIRFLAERIAEELGLAVTFKVESPIDGNRLGDIARICEVSEHDPQFDVRTGLARMLSGQNSTSFPNAP